MTMNGVDEVTSPLSPCRRHSCVWSLVSSLLVLAVAAVSCSSATTEMAEPVTSAPPAAEKQVESTPLPEPSADDRASPTPGAVTPASSATATATPHPLAAADTELPPAPIGIDQVDQLVAPRGPQPVSIEIENINVRRATVIPVGVNQDDLSFEVPPADQVGWYEFGPTPGEPGSSVLAAHIAFNGVDGVFRYLEDVEVGSVVVIGFDDGSTSRYRIEEVVEYVKEELPDSLFARDGREQLVLITCGGSFNYQLDSYESNTVALAVPI